MDKNDSRSIPASIWNLPRLRALDFMTIALHQIDFGSRTVKPTRIIFNFGLERICPSVPGWPKFFPDGSYKGPLDSRPNPPGTSLMRKGPLEEGPFKTAAAAAYPQGLCKALASAMIDSFLAASSSAPDSSEDLAYIPTGSHKATSSTAPSGGESSTGCEREGRKRDIMEIESDIDVDCDVDFSSPNLGERGETWIEEEAAILDNEAQMMDNGGEEEPELESFVPDRKGWWGKGPPIRTTDNSRFIRDGGGYCSPGRWHPDDRILPPQAAALRDIVDRSLPAELQKDFALRVLTGKADGSLLKETGKKIATELELLLRGQGLQRDCPKPHGQAIDFGLLAMAAEFLGDPDAGFARKCLLGVPIGFGIDLQSNPAIWPPKRKWKLDKKAGGTPQAINKNYPSADLYREQLSKEIEEQIAGGMMQRTTFKKAKERYGNRLRIASLAVINEGESYRVVHDATNRVMINHEIRIPDCEQFPGPRDVEGAITADGKRESKPSKYMGVKSDVSKAHRRIPIAEEDWGLQSSSCQDPPENLDDWVIELNTVGTYGLGSAAWYWGRAGALILRILHYVSLIRYAFRFADDFLLVSAPSAHQSTLIPIFRCFALFEAFSIPIKWSKTSGGATLTWIGFEFNFSQLSFGLSRGRAEWVSSWVEKVTGDFKDILVIRQMEGFLGRFGFAAQVLRHMRPFLAPLYSWVAMANKSHCSRVPVAIRLVIKWIAKLVLEKPMVTMRAIRTSAGEVFRADAKAEGDTIVVGGWEVIGGELSRESRWFSVHLDQTTAPWAYWKGKPFKSIAALELFASLLCIIAFQDRIQGSSVGTVTVRGITDNQGNQSIVKRCMTTRFPGCIVRMELVSWLEALGADLDLAWQRRDSNQEADDLTNDEFDKFNPATRIRLDLNAVPWKVMPWIAGASQDMYLALAKEKLEREKGPHASLKRTRVKTNLRVSEPW